MRAKGEEGRKESGRTFINGPSLTSTRAPRNRVGAVRSRRPSPTHYDTAKTNWVRLCKRNEREKWETDQIRRESSKSILVLPRSNRFVDSREHDLGLFNGVPSSASELQVSLREGRR